MKKIFLLAIVSVHFLACNSKNTKMESKEVAKDSVATVTKSEERNTISVYEGLLPCADCSGIETVLKINLKTNEFELSSIYKGKSPEKEFTEKGKLNTERGLEKDPDGTIYVLNWDQPTEKQIYYGYYSAKPEKIYFLDRDKKIIKSKLNYALQLKK